MSRAWVPQSLRGRLQVWLGVILVATLAAFAVIVNRLQVMTVARSGDEALHVRVTALNRALREVYRLTPPPLPPNRGPRPPRFDDRERPAPPPGDIAFPQRPPPPPPVRTPGEPVQEKGSAGRREDPPVRPGEGRTLSLPAAATDLFDDPDFYYVIWYRDGTVLGRSPNAPAGVAPPAMRELDTLPHFRDAGRTRELIHCSGLRDCVLAGRFLDKDRDAINTSRLRLAGGSLLLLGTGLLLGRALSARALRPLTEIRAAAARIAVGRLSERVPIHAGGSELGQLALVLNDTFDRLESAFVRQEQFTANAAHELRTPLTVMTTVIQSTLVARRSPGEYQESLSACLSEVQRMREITESLLSLARLDSGQDAEERTSISLGTVMSEAADALRDRALERGIALICEPCEAVVRVRRSRIRQLLVNLLDNAIDHTPPGGRVTLEAEVGATDAVLVVSDTGRGIPAEQLPHVFERFFRGDAAGSTDQGHTGLGLAICEAIVRAEGGTIGVESSPGSGTTFEVRLAAVAGLSMPDTE